MIGWNYLFAENQQVHERLATALPRLSQCYALNTPVVNVPKLYPVVVSQQKMDKVSGISWSASGEY